MSFAPVSRQVRNNLETTRGWHGKASYSLAHHRVNLSVLTRFQAADTDWVKHLHARARTDRSVVLAFARRNFAPVQLNAALGQLPRTGLRPQFNFRGSRQYIVSRQRTPDTL